MSDQYPSEFLADGLDDTSLVEDRLHSRRTLLTGAAAAMGLAIAGAGAAVVSAPAGATTTRDERHASGASVAGARSEPHSAGSDFSVVGSSKFVGATTLQGPNSFAGPSSFTDVVKFARSGLVTIGAGQSQGVHANVALSSTSLVLATMQGFIHGLYVSAVVPSVATRSFRIYLSQAVPVGNTAKIAWFVVN
jgi:hypothetical protein